MLNFHIFADYLFLKLLIFSIFIYVNITIDVIFADYLFLSNLYSLVLICVISTTDFYWLSIFNFYMFPVSCFLFHYFFESCALYYFCFMFLIKFDLIPTVLSNHLLRKSPNYLNSIHYYYKKNRVFIKGQSTLFISS